VSQGLVFDVKKYAIHDGPGIRTTVFFKGCPLRCPWCHNPEGQLAKPEVMVKAPRCLPGCRVCIKSCELKAITRTPKALEVNRYECNGCGACADACPSQAIELAGRRMDAAEVSAKIFQDAIFHESSGGGVTFSGGEPLMQPEFLLELLRACRLHGIHAAVDTSGYAPQEQLRAAAGLTDLFLYDLKTMDDARHLECTGVSNAAILDNLAALGRMHQNIWIRIPIVPGFNDDAEQLDAAARFVASIPAVRQVSLLPYHPTGNHKSRWLGPCEVKPQGSTVPGHASLCPSHPSQAPTRPFPADMEEAANRFRALGLNVQTGG